MIEQVSPWTLMIFVKDFRSCDIVKKVLQELKIFWSEHNNERNHIS